MDISEQTVIINPHAMLPVGTLLLNGKYRIERHLSSGGFGNTYVATNTEFEEQIAIKEFFMRGITERDGDSVSVSVSNRNNVEQFISQKEKFKKEARRLRRLKNEHIVGVHDLFEENGTAYFEMDLIKGESLAERMKRTDLPLSEEDALKILDQILDALSVVHAQGLYHLDLKPANIMIDETGRALLIDFGASKQMSTGDGLSVSTSSTLAFTPGFAPLEQTEQNIKSFGPWTDIYALGATLYKLLTGLTPPSASEILMATMPLTFPTPISTKTQQLIIWMMKPRINERPQSIVDVKRILDDKIILDKEKFVEKQQHKLRFKIHPRSRKSIKLWRNIVLTIVSVIVLGLLLVQVPVVKNTIYQITGWLTTLFLNTSHQADEIITVNGVSFKMIGVQGGTFTMGATAEQGNDADCDEYYAHQVTLSTFSIGETEVTQELWQAVMGNNPSHFKGLHLPVENVSWEDCQSFIDRLNAMTGRHFRLPTEAEWEYAARGGRKTRGYKYSGSNSVDDVAWYDHNSGYRTHDVATKQTNELGIYDMSGNVYEWCQDVYGEYSSGFEINPTDPTIPLSEEYVKVHVHRGGGWYYNSNGCRVSNRRYVPYLCGDDITGLRLAL